MKQDRKRVTVANPSDGGFVYWLLKFYLFGVLSCGAFMVAAMPLVYLMIGSIVPRPPKLKAFKKEAAIESHIFSADSSLLTTLAKERRYLVEVDEVPTMLIKAFLAAEDKNFYNHGGVDFKGILRAAWANLRAKRWW